MVAEMQQRIWAKWKEEEAALQVQMPVLQVQLRREKTVCLLPEQGESTSWKQ